AGDEFAPPPGMKVINTDASLVGAWRCEHPLVKSFKNNDVNQPEEYFRDEKGNIQHVTIDMEFFDNGRYRASTDIPGPIEETGKGKYSFVPGKSFSLTYETGIDYFSVEKLTADEMVWRIPVRALDTSVLADVGQPVLVMYPVYTFKRVK